METTFFDSVQAWLQVHQMWLGPAIAVAAFLETLVVVGLLLPGVAILFALATLAGSGLLDLLPVYLWAFTGAVLGDAVSYQLGYHFHHNVRGWWPFRKHPHWLDNGEAFIDRHGVLSIVLGRFIGPVRPVVPVLAGMLNMLPRRFYIANLLSSIPWALVYLTPGYLTGAAVELGLFHNIPEWAWWALGGVCLMVITVVWVIKSRRKQS